jgi:hypothetical protein
MKKMAFPILVFVVISNLMIIVAIIYSGIDAFLFFWRLTSLKYTLGIVIISLISYLIWIKHINDKKESAELSAFEYTDALEANADKDLMFAMCPKCENDCYYSSKNYEEPIVLICWSCQQTFSSVWCEKCGMGGDFVTNISEKPPSWQCPDCHSTYAIPADIYENPIKTVAKENLPATVHASHAARQIRFQIDQATTSVWLLSSLLISFTLVLPITDSFYRALIRYGLTPTSLLFTSCGGFLMMCIVFISTWYGLIFYPLAIVRKIKQLQDGQREQI